MDNGWGEWKNYVLTELKLQRTSMSKVDDGMSKVKEGMSALRVEMAKLHMRSGVWGLAAGFIPITIAIAIGLLR